MPTTQPTLPEAAAAAIPPHVPTAHQWLSATTGRIAPDGYSWMQAVCWAHLDNTYRPNRGHGPQHIGDTTLRVAVELARLAPCRPGVDYLVRVLKLSKRTVQYHLGILREAGLLTYQAKGTRVRGEGGRASEFIWTIPAAFDIALHLITRACDRYIRALQGIADEGRATMKRLAKMARKLMRRPRRSRPTGPSAKRPSSAPRCTPMEGGSSTSSSAATTTSPSESKLETGNRHAPAPKKSRKARKLNAVGRRHQLAYELIQQVPWLHRAAVPRIAWVIQDVADAGWTAEEVIAVINEQAPTRTVHRPSGFLARRLAGALRRFDTPAKRQALVTWWRDSREAERARHVEWEGAWQAPRSRAVTRLVRQAINAVRHTEAPAGQAVEQDDQALTDDQLQVLRETAHQAFLAGDTGLVTSTVAFRGRVEAERIYGAELVGRALRLRSASSHLKVGAGL
ncbi:helix-turn-helix domain-containing protein [Streptomyces sp. NPDC047049]|uniref:helix-turn-helix domain-containing protein n=1 Tax=Streptomyces sp. NPDC047049 TaxID=3156688 RepID=UPI003411CF90